MNIGARRNGLALLRELPADETSAPPCPEKPMARVYYWRRGQRESLPAARADGRALAYTPKGIASK